MMITHEVLQDTALILFVTGVICNGLAIAALMRRQQVMRQEIAHLSKGLVMLMTDLHNRMELQQALTGLDEHDETQHERLH